MVLISNLNYIAVAVVGALQVTAGAMTIGGIQAFIQFSRLFSQPMGQIGGMLNLMQSCVASAGRVFDLLDAPEIPPDAGPGPARRPTLPAARMAAAGSPSRRVTFGYRPGSPVVRDLSFTVEPGQTVAIVGHTGAGKTTVVNLLMRFYELGFRPDHRRRHGHRRTATRTGCGPGSARCCRTPGCSPAASGTTSSTAGPGAGEADILAAAQASHVDQFVRALPDGYDTMLGNDGDSLSRGQRQLISIARAQLAGRSILVLDEATSSVDSRTEVQIRQAMRGFRQGRTSFVIAHRLSTVRDADLILVMDHGRIVEQGTHRPADRQGRAVPELYRAQFARREQATGVLEPGL